MPDAPPDTNAETHATDAQDASELDLGQQVDEFLAQVEQSAKKITEQFGDDQAASLTSAEIDVDDVIDDAGAVVKPPAVQGVEAPASGKPDQDDQDAIIELGAGASDSGAAADIAEEETPAPPADEPPAAHPADDANPLAPQVETAELETQVDELIEQATATETEPTDEAPPPSGEEAIEEADGVSAAIKTPLDEVEEEPAEPQSEDVSASAIEATVDIEEPPAPQEAIADADSESESQAASAESEAPHTTIVEIDEQLADAADEALTDTDPIEGQFLSPEEAIDEAPESDLQEEDVIEVISASSADEPEAIVEIASPEEPATDPGELAQSEVGARPEKAESSEEPAQGDATVATTSSFPKKFAAIAETGAQTLLILVNKPFAKLSPQLRSLIGWIGLVTIFNAVALWIFLLLR